MKTVIGIDSGTAHIGIVICDEKGDVILEELWQPEVKGAERLAWVRDKLKYVVKTCYVTHAAIEGYSYMSKWRAHDLGEMGGMIRLLLHDMGIPFDVVPPQTLKKFATGKGNTKKEFIVLHVFKKWGKEFDDTHRADAYSLCQWALEKM